MPDAADLIAHARESRVVVIGAAGAIAALECARVGLSVTLVDDESGPTWADLAGVVVGADLDGFRSDDPALAALHEELGVTGSRESVLPVATWIGRVDGDDPAVAPLPEGALFGIPGNPWDPAARRVIGWAGTWRAYLDRLRPPLTIGRERNLGALVRSRMGDRVCDRLVAPVTRARLDLSPDEIDVDLLLPGLNTALTRTGSLAGAVSSEGEPAPARSVLRDARERDAALAARLEEFAVDRRADVRVTGLARAEGRWSVAFDDGTTLPADAVIVATGHARALALLADVAPLPEVPLTAPTDIALLRLRGVMADDGGAPDVACVSGHVRRIVDLTAARPGLRARLAPDERIFAVVQRATDAADAPVVADALTASIAVWGTSVRAAEVVAAARLTVDGTLPPVRLGAADDLDAIRVAVRDVEGLGLTGGWLTGGDEAAVAADAVAEGDRIRRRLLWGAGEQPL